MKFKKKNSILSQQIKEVKQKSKLEILLASIVVVKILNPWQQRQKLDNSLASVSNRSTSIDVTKQ